MSAAASTYDSQARLWLVAFGASALINLAGIGVLSFWVLDRISLNPRTPVAPPALGDAVTVITPEMIAASPTAPAADAAEADSAATPPADPGFARTSLDQLEAPPERRDFIGERNTLATSDAPPVADAPDLPSQQGREPTFEGEIETTQSAYQDGDLAHDRIAKPTETPPAEPQAPAPAPAAPSESTAPASEAALTDSPPEPIAPPPAPTTPRETIAEGPLPVERHVVGDDPSEAPKPVQPVEPAQPEQATAAESSTTPPKRPDSPPPRTADPTTPGFRGNQTKTRIVGSLSRTGRSALNVEDSAIGRYQAAIGRAVEKEWQLNCIRNRDFITPGVLTMTFRVDAAGRVSGVRVVDELEVGAIPKGFTLNSIHDAEIPAMPADLKRQLDGESIELLFRFAF